MSTMSEEYDKKLKSGLYLAMLQLHDNLSEFRETVSDSDIELQRVLTNAQESCDSYFKCIEGDRHV